MASSLSSTHSTRASSRSCKYDVYLSFRGEDTRKTFVDHLYSTLQQHLISVYKDDKTLPRGVSIGLSLFKAIEESRIGVIIFSKNYADSSWCLEELAHIMKCKDERELIVMPIFYDVDPSEVRKQNGDFGKAFAQQEVENIKKAQLWRNALVAASNIAGWEPKHIANGYESKVIKEIVDTILDRLFPSNSEIIEDLVGMTTRLQDLKSRLEIGSGGVRMVGVWGVGGGGKTTLAFSLCMKLSGYFESHHIVENIREESSKYGLKKLQENLLSALFKTKVEVQSIIEGKLKLKCMLCHKNVLIILDDVNNLDQLEALAGSHKWFGSGSRIIITTRDEHLLRSHKVDTVYPVRLLSEHEAIWLFHKYAYNEKDTIEDYKALSSQVVSYAAGLPLALKVLGSFLYDKDKKEWMSTLARLKDIPELEIVEKLKVSYDGLKPSEKELFLNIACFFRGKRKDKAMKILEACGFHAEIGIKVLRQKTLISIVDDRFDMHDLVQEMGHYIVRGEHPNNPEKHSKVWKREEIFNMCSGDATMENDKIEAIRYDGRSCDHGDSSRLCKIVSNMKKLRYLRVIMYNVDKYAEGPNFLSNELLYIDWEGYPAHPFPYSFQPMKLVVLKLRDSLQKEVWKGYKHLPHLRLLELDVMKKLLGTPDFDGLPRLQKLTLDNCYGLKDIHPSLGNHISLEYVRISCCKTLKMFPTIVQMENLKTLEIEDCGFGDGEIPSGISELSNLQALNLSWNDFSCIHFTLSQLTRLKLLNLSGCRKLVELPELPASLAIREADQCYSLEAVGDSHIKCKGLCQVSLTGGNIINDSGRLLQSMLEGKAIENHSMLLKLEGVEVAKGFRPPLLRGSRCRLQLPENWCNAFSGFLMCAVLPDKWRWSKYVRIYMDQIMSDMDHEDVVWEGSYIDDDNYMTWAGYVSFGSLKHTAWWDQTYEVLDFSFQDERCIGFGVRLVEKKSRSGLTETSTDSSDYKPHFNIVHDSVSALTFSLSFYDLDQ